MTRQPVRFKIGYVMTTSGAVPETFATSIDDANFERNVKRMLERWPKHLNVVSGFVETECVPGDEPAAKESA